MQYSNFLCALINNSQPSPLPYRLHFRWVVCVQDVYIIYFAFSAYSDFVLFCLHEKSAYNIPNLLADILTYNLSHSFSWF